MDLATTTGSTEQPTLANHDDAAERFMQDVIRRFHAEHRHIYTALAFKRVRTVSGHRVVVEAARIEPARRGARAKWTLIFWNADEVSIRFQPAASRKAVLTVFLFVK